MDATFHVGYGQDLNVTVELVDADMGQATTLLGQACNELLRMNPALDLQASDLSGDGTPGTPQADPSCP